ncbi:hypothetical protein KQI65_06245 [bacterium]|nr:hypothetical protein [bacterium]
MRRSHTPRSIHQFIPFVLSLSILAGALSACEEPSSPDTVISVRITQPTDSTVIRDTVLRILTETSSSCGCQAYVEFHVDGNHRYSDYLPFFSYDLDIRDMHGWHVIATRVVVGTRGDAWDTVHVLLNPIDSLKQDNHTDPF